MGSLMEVDRLTRKLETAVTSTHTLGDVRDSMQDFWTEVTRWASVGPHDELFNETAETLKAFNITRLRTYTDHADFYADAAPLLLTLRSVREMLIRWAGVADGQYSCNTKNDILVPVFRHHKPDKTDYRNVGMKYRLQELADTNAPELMGRGVIWSQMPKILQISKRDDMDWSVGLRLSKLTCDTSRILGAINTERLPPQPEKWNGAQYVFGDHTLNLRVRWGSELAPQVFTNEDEKNVPRRYDRQMLALSQVFNILERARKLRIPLVAYPGPVGRDPIQKD